MCSDLIQNSETTASKIITRDWIHQETLVKLRGELQIRNYQLQSWKFKEILLWLRETQRTATIYRHWLATLTWWIHLTDCRSISSAQIRTQMLSISPWAICSMLEAWAEGTEACFLQECWQAIKIQLGEAARCSNLLQMATREASLKVRYTILKPYRPNE